MPLRGPGRVARCPLHKLSRKAEGSRRMIHSPCGSRVSVSKATRAAPKKAFPVRKKAAKKLSHLHRAEPVYVGLRSPRRQWRLPSQTSHAQCALINLTRFFFPQSLTKSPVGKTLWKSRKFRDFFSPLSPYHSHIIPRTTDNPFNFGPPGDDRSHSVAQSAEHQGARS